MVELGMVKMLYSIMMEDT
jgi:hypothetical protein